MLHFDLQLQLIKDISRVIFQDNFKDYLSILVGPLFQHLLFHYLQLHLVAFTLKLNETVSLTPLKLTGEPL